MTDDSAPRHALQKKDPVSSDPLAPSVFIHVGGTVVVSDEQLVAFADAAADDAATRPFPALGARLRDALRAQLERRRAVAEALVRDLVAMETRRINLRHPDFIGVQVGGVV